MPERNDSGRIPDRILDRQIDSALATYAAPRLGLEQRMLARVSGEATKVSSRRRWVLLVIGLPLTASLLLLAYFAPRKSQQHRQVADAPAASSPDRVLSTPEALAPPHPVSRVQVRSVKRRPNRPRLSVAERPKLDIFPTLQPLSDSEQAITRFAAEASEAERKALVAPNQKFTEPIQITAIHIPPLPSPEEDKN